MNIHFTTISLHISHHAAKRDTSFVLWLASMFIHLTAHMELRNILISADS